MDTYTPTADPLAWGMALTTIVSLLPLLISPQNLAIAATRVALEGKEPVILKKVAGRLVGLLLVLCVPVYLQSTPILGWMLQIP